MLPEAHVSSPIALIIHTIVIFFHFGQFRGFFGSWGPSQGLVGVSDLLPATDNASSKSEFLIEPLKPSLAVSPSSLVFGLCGAILIAAGSKVT